ncbi:MAG: hypothetical protein E6J79_09875 [Deltaproteobacteria bacterium]|nr:MAG: hypothetical protein E6J79_09875 [Deltaproteobacteria bacterium]
MPQREPGAARRARRDARRTHRLEVKAERRVTPAAARGVQTLVAVFLLSGSAGLMHEVVWVRLLGLVFGATSLAVSTVLAAFMGGLALGSHGIGRRLPHIADPRRAYGLLEIGIGIAALAVPLLLDVIQPVYGWLWRRFHFSFAVFSVLRFVLAGGLLLVPTALMGATLPALAEYLAGVRGRQLAPEWLYTVNLVGAALGVIAAGFVLMPTVGVSGTIVAAAALNVAIGCVVLRLPRLPAAPAEAVTGTAPTSPALVAAAFASGAMSFAAQVAWTRVLVLVVGSTTYAFSSVLLAYLAALGAGSAWASRRGRRLADVRPELGKMHLLMAVCLLAAVAAADRLPYWYADLWEGWRPAGLAGLVAMNTSAVFALLFLPALFAGTILPLVLVGAVSAERHRTGPVVGRLYAVNTIGAIVGAIFTGFVAIPRFGSQTTLLAIAVAGALIGLAFALVVPRSPARTTAAVVGVALVVAGVVVRPGWHQVSLNAGVFEAGADEARQTVRRKGQLLFHREGPTATVVVMQWRDGRTLAINGRVNASDLQSDMYTQVMMAELPLLLAPRADDALLVGWGSGVSAGVALETPLKRLRAVELEPAVIAASRRFEHVNHHPYRNPRLRLLEDDARHILLADDATYDVIMSEPSHPWVSGVANVFTQDFFRLAAARLRPEGLFAQWVQAYQIPLESFRAILGTFQSVFPEVMVFVPPTQVDTILIGSRRPIRIDLGELERRWANPRMRAENARIGFERPEHLLACLTLGPDAVRRLTAGAALNTDDNMFVEFQAPRNMVRSDTEAAVVVATLERAATPVESVLTDAGDLLGNRERLTALIEGLGKSGRRADAYRKRLGELP